MTNQDPKTRILKQLTERDMMKTSKMNTLEAYTDSIKAIGEGQRNDTLYHIGLQLRKTFGLCGAEMLRQLCDINSEKCNPPLDDGEVETIANSVDSSDVPIGSIRYSAEEYLSKEISFFDSATATQPSETMTIMTSSAKIPFLI